MVRPAGICLARRDWVAAAKPHDHHLDASNPMWVVAAHQPYPLPLDMHMHRGMEVGIVMSGEEEMHFADLVLRLGPGEVWLSAMWEPHAWRPTRRDTRIVVLICLPVVIEESGARGIPWLKMFAASPRERPRAATPKIRQSVLALGQDLRYEIEETPASWQAMVRLHLVRLLIILSREWRPPDLAGRQARVDANQLARIAPAITLANSALQGRVDPREAAAACSLSSSRFHHIFRQAMGISFGRFCLRARLAYAAHRLLTTDLPVRVIAEEAGFADGSHLHHKFVAQYSATPAEYRQRGRLLDAASRPLSGGSPGR